MSQQIDEIRRSLCEIIKGIDRRAPKDDIIRRLIASYPPAIVDSAIEQALDQLEIDQLIDYDTREEGHGRTEAIWYLRILNEKEAHDLQSLKPVARALLKLLYKQGDYEHLGQMRVEDARTRLTELGFPLSETKYISVEGRVDVFWRFRSGQQEEWFRIIPEYEKTAEYRAAEDEAERELDEHISIQTYMTEKLENEDEKRRKRAASRKKRPKQQST